jgi:hypothetical protein
MKSTRYRRIGSIGTPSSSTTSHGTMPSAGTTRPHFGSRIDPMSRSSTSNNLTPPFLIKVE